MHFKTHVRGNGESVKQTQKKVGPCRQSTKEESCDEVKDRKAFEKDGGSSNKADGAPLPCCSSCQYTPRNGMEYS